jgi:GNAT superfamily N-acetyltransferase
MPRSVRIELVRDATVEIHAALQRLLPQLNPALELPDMARLQRLVADPAVTLLVAREEAEIVGTTTVIVYTTPFTIKARLDEVVVDGGARGKGAGEALVKAALEIARERGAQMAELQSGRGSSREAAHRLYARLGFRIIDSDLMRIRLQPRGGAKGFVQ